MLACTGMGACHLFKWSATDTAGRGTVLHSSAYLLRHGRCCSHGEHKIMLDNNIEQLYSAHAMCRLLLMYGQGMATCADRVHRSCSIHSDETHMAPLSRTAGTAPDGRASTGMGHFRFWDPCE
jgi:hypothetical protein